MGPAALADASVSTDPSTPRRRPERKIHPIEVENSPDLGLVSRTYQTLLVLIFCSGWFGPVDGPLRPAILRSPPWRRLRGCDVVRMDLGTVCEKG